MPLPLRFFYPLSSAGPRTTLTTRASVLTLARAMIADASSNCVYPSRRVNSLRDKRKKKARECILASANGTCVYRLDCATGRSGRERLRKGSS